MKGRVTKRENEEPLGGSFCKWPQRAGLLQAKARSFFQVSNMGSMKPHTWTMLYCFSDTLTWDWIGSEAVSTQTSARWDALAADSSWTCNCTMPAPQTFSFTWTYHALQVYVMKVSAIKQTICFCKKCYFRKQFMTADPGSTSHDQLHHRCDYEKVPLYFRFLLCKWEW